MGRSRVVLGAAVTGLVAALVTVPLVVGWPAFAAAGGKHGNQGPWSATVTEVRRSAQAALAASDASASSQSSASPYHLQCDDVLVVGARGSGEVKFPGRPGAPYTYGGFGFRAAAMTRHLVGVLASHRSVGTYPITFFRQRPLSVWSLFPHFSASSPYFDNIAAGVTKVTDTLAQQATACPDQVFVLTGYSQGAIVVHRALADLAAQGRRDVLDRVAGAVLIGDGDRTRQPAGTHVVGAPAPSGNGAGITHVLGQHTRIPESVAARTWEVCSNRDLVCDNRLSLHDLTRLTANRIQNGQGRAARAARRGIAVHTGATYLHGAPRMIRQAADRVATLVRGWPTPGSQTRIVAPGTAVSVQLTADVRGSMAGQVRWGDVANLPPGLSLSPTGVVTGTPTATGEWTTTYTVTSATTGIYARPVHGSITWVIQPDDQPGVWTPRRIPAPSGSTGLGLRSGFTCPSANWCAASATYGVRQSLRDTDVHPVLVVLNHGHWHSVALPAPADGVVDSAYVQTISCAAPEHCVLVGDYQETGGGSLKPLAVTYDNGSMAAHAIPSPTGGASTGGYESRVSCPAVSWCVAVGSQHGVSTVDTYAGGGWTSSTLPPPAGVDPGDTFLVNDVSCAAVGVCDAVGGYRDPTTQNTEPLDAHLAGGKWTATTVPLPPDAATNGNGYTYLLHVACANADLCAADGLYETSTGQFNFAAARSHGTWTSTRVAAAAGASQVSTASSWGWPACPSSDWCAAQVGTWGTEVFDGTGWTDNPVDALPGPAHNGEPTDMSCAAAASCVTVGWFGTPGQGFSDLAIAMLSGHTWTYLPAPDIVTGSRLNLLYSVSCPATNRCLATGSEDNTALIETYTASQ